MGVKETPPRDLPIPAELEKHIREHAPEFLARAVESAAKRGFAVEYKAVPAQKAPDCYDCEYCRRLRYLKGEWHCRIYKPDEVPNPCTLTASRFWIPISRRSGPQLPRKPRKLQNRPRSRWPILWRER